jgi:hypothetical protein
MRTIILTVPEKKEKWFRSLFNQLHIKHKILSEEAKEELLMAKLIDEAMSEEGEIPKEKIYRFIKRHGH